MGEQIDVGSASNEKYYVVTGKNGKCAGSASAPVWIARQGKDNTEIILSASGFTVEALTKFTNGLQDLRVSGGNAGSAFVEYWQYNGTKYVLKSQKNFDVLCKNFKNDAENPFDCENSAE